MKKKSAALFHEKQHFLGRRLMPTTSELQVVAILLEFLKGSLQNLLFTVQLTSAEDLITRATQVELDEGEE